MDKKIDVAIDLLRDTSIYHLERLHLSLGMVTDNRTIRLFTCDCQIHLLHFEDPNCPEDIHHRYLLKVERGYANGTIGEEKLIDIRYRANVIPCPRLWLENLNPPEWDAMWWAVHMAHQARHHGGIFDDEVEWQIGHLIKMLRGETQAVTIQTTCDRCGREMLGDMIIECSDGLPHVICPDCEWKVEKWYEEYRLGRKKRKE